jgi:hypothetical protein
MDEERLSTPEPEGARSVEEGSSSRTLRDAVSRWLSWTVVALAIGIALWDAAVELWG